MPILKIKTPKLEINVYIHFTTIFIFRIFKLFSNLADTFHTKQLTVSGVVLYSNPVVGLRRWSGTATGQVQTDPRFII